MDLPAINKEPLVGSFSGLVSSGVVVCSGDAGGGRMDNGAVDCNSFVVGDDDDDDAVKNGASTEGFALPPTGFLRLAPMAYI